MNSYVEPVQILYVEDDPNDRELTLRALRDSKLSNEVTVARDGVEALEALFGEDDTGGPLRFQPGLILLDLQLPRLDGIEVLRRIKEDPRSRHLPVTMLTSSREEQDVIESYDLGANSYIVKPLSFANLSEVVHQLSLYWVLLNEPPVPRHRRGAEGEETE